MKNLWNRKKSCAKILFFCSSLILVLVFHMEELVSKRKNVCIYSVDTYSTLVNMKRGKFITVIIIIMDKNKPRILLHFPFNYAKRKEK